MMTGNAPASGMTNQFTMTHTNHAVLTWLWGTNYWLDTETHGPGSLTVADGWHIAGSTPSIGASASPGNRFDRWSGDVPAGAARENPLSVTMDRPRQLTAHFVELHPGTFANEWRMNNGTLRVNGRVRVSRIHVSPGARLEGAGTVDAYGVVAGTVAPGSDEPTDADTLTVGSSLVFLPGGVFECYAASDTSLDKIVAAGQVSGACEVRLSRSPSAAPSGETIVDGHATSDYTSFSPGGANPSQWTLTPDGAGKLLVDGAPLATLNVVSAHGSADPPVGLTVSEMGASVTCRVSRVETAGTTEYVCSGWAMTGNAPASGMTNQFTMTHTNHAVLTWLWGTNYWLDTETHGPGSLTVADGWHIAGSTPSIGASASPGNRFDRWSGDVPAGAARENPLSVTMDRPRQLTAHFVELHPGTFANEWRMNNGTLRVNGRVRVSRIHVSPGARLEGAGTVDAYGVVAGTVAPGSDEPTDADTLTVGSSLVFLPGGVFECYAASDTSLDKIVAAGQVSGACEVRLSRSPWAAPSGETIVDGHVTSDYAHFSVGGPRPGDWQLTANATGDLLLDSLALPPTLVSHTPAVHALDVARDASIEMTFSAEMDPTTIGTHTLTANGSLSGPVAGSFNVVSNVVTFSPADAFRVGEQVTVTVSPDVLSMAGLAMSRPYTWQFTARAPYGPGIFVDSGQRLASGPWGHAALGDLDGDGDPDAFVAVFGDANRVWTNRGDGVFMDSGEALGSGESEQAALGDLDGDGDLDAFTANSQGPNRVWLNNGDGSFVDSGQGLGDAESVGIALGDLDGEGDLDGLVGNATGGSRVWLNNGGGVFGDSGQSLGVSSGVPLGDVDGDGDLDALLGNQVWTNNSHGVFGNSGRTVGSTADSFALGDLDGDGGLDAFVAVGGHPDQVWFNDGTGGFTNSGQGLGNTVSGSVSLGDLDGDGDLDAFVGNHSLSGPGNTVWFNDGSGTFSHGGQTFAGAWSRMAALGDLDGDGDLDAFVCRRETEALEVWLNRRFDFGDLPAAYGITLLADNGARHEIPNAGAFHLGAAVDGETNGVESASADGDDSSGAAPDDEDGVAWVGGGALYPGVAKNLRVTVHTNGYLNAWVDYDADGSFAGSGEQLCTNRYLSGGIERMCVRIPGTIGTGPSYARFRFGTQSGLSWTGAASDGEVEDYLVTLKSAGQSHSVTNATLHLGGTSAGTGYDQIVVDGAATLSGTLVVKLQEGFTPRLGDSFVLVDAGSLAGNFDSLVLPPLKPGREWSLQYTTLEVGQDKSRAAKTSSTQGLVLTVVTTHGTIIVVR